MSKSSRMGTVVTENHPASEWQSDSRKLSKPVQIAFVFDRNARLTALYEGIRRALAKFGGQDALRAALDERESYIATISKAINGQDGRSTPVDWLLILGEPRRSRL